MVTLSQERPNAKSSSFLNKNLALFHSLLNACTQLPVVSSLSEHAVSKSIGMALGEAMEDVDVELIAEATLDLRLFCVCLADTTLSSLLSPCGPNGANVASRLSNESTFYNQHYIVSKLKSSIVSNIYTFCISALLFSKYSDSFFNSMSLTSMPTSLTLFTLDGRISSNSIL